MFIVISGIAISLLNQSISDYNRLIAGAVAQEHSQSVSFWANGLIFLGAIAVVLLVLLILRKSLLQPLTLINAHLSQLADGNFRQPLHFSGSGELGHLSKNISKVQQSVAEVITAVQQSMSTLTQASNAITRSSSSLAGYANETHHATDQVSAAIT